MGRQGHTHWQRRAWRWHLPPSAETPSRDPRGEGRPQQRTTHPSGGDKQPPTPRFHGNPLEITPSPGCCRPLQRKSSG